MPRGTHGTNFPKRLDLCEKRSIQQRGSSHLPVGLQGQQAGGHTTVQFTEDVHTQLQKLRHEENEGPRAEQCAWSTSVASFHAWEYRVRRVTLGPHVFGAELLGAGSHSPRDCGRGTSGPGPSPALIANPRGALKLLTRVHSKRLPGGA